MDFLQIVQALNPFMDRGGETYIEVEIEGNEQLEQIPLDTALARDIVRSMLCPLFPRGLPTDRETRAAVDVLRGCAFSRPRRDAVLSADHVIAKRPLAQAVLSVARKGGTKKTLPELLAMLTRTAQREGIDLKSGPWPATEDALGRQLSLLEPVLALKQVKLVRHENERPRTWAIPPLLEGSVERDGQVTVATATETGTSAHSVTSTPYSGPETSDEEIEALLEDTSDARPTD